MLVIRPEAPHDYAAVYAVVEAAFGKPAEADLVSRLRSVDGVISLVAEDESGILGHIMFSPVTLHHKDGKPQPTKLVGLAPVAVRPDFQNQGVGGRLITAGLQESRSAGFLGCFLIGHPEYYPRFGFQSSQSTFGITSTYDVPDPVFMGMELIEGALSSLKGTIHYHPIFQGI